MTAAADAASYYARQCARMQADNADLASQVDALRSRDRQLLDELAEARAERDLLGQAHLDACRLIALHLGDAFLAAHLASNPTTQPA